MGLLVVDPGFFTTVQDLGRPGARAFGVPLGGAFDRESLTLANALAGDEPGPAALEMTLRGGAFEARCDLGIAVAGAAVPAAIVAEDGSRRPVAVPSSAWLRRGERIELGRADQGARTYLATPGGFQVGAWLGSRSDERPVRQGDFLPAGPSRLPCRRPAAVDRREPPDALRILPGPDWSLLDDPDAVCSARFRIGSRSDRMGLRLEGEGGSISVATTADRLSAPVTPGAIQAAGGRLIVLGVSCGTMGGYPHVAQVISADLDRLGRLRPGDPIAFRTVATAEARALDREGRMRLRSLSLRIAAAARDGLG
ncbi:5-oxoprolinase subunit C family protein [Paludisphaera soli]|uniref:5-oxoprolinase subunit C family protein n=1 Tax=Paludisphaera soli TaxID=2712865 RepID=UPI0013EE04BD|nr:allophanate hydrolase [Paludisphaera soli]